MDSFSILRTNTGLTTNLKIIVDSNYGLFMESIDSAPELSASKFKKVRFNKDNYFDSFFSHFYKNLPAEIAFGVKYDNDNDNQFNDFTNQYDDIYQMGARNIIDNKNFQEEFEFFAPLYFSKGKFPKHFVIFRVDGPGLINLNKDNFKSEIVNKFKCVRSFDLTRNTQLGEWIEKSFTKNTLFPDTPLEVDFRLDEFTRWYGVDFKTGGYSHKSAFLNDTLEYENTIFDLEKFISDGYQRNQIVFPNIINFSFLFDDTPATPTSLRKWSLNRYFGFYLKDMDLVTSISPYIPVSLKSDVKIDSNNNIMSISSSYPFSDGKNEIDFINRFYYVEYLGNFYKVEQYSEKQQVTKTKVKSSNNVTKEEFTQPEVYRYRIISDLNLEGLESSLNKNICLLDSNNYIVNYIDKSSFVIDGFDDADVWLIEIDGKMHNIIKDNNKLKVNTDYAFTFTVENYSYFINSPVPQFSKKVSLIVDADNSPKNFKIWRLNFTDIKDFDNAIIDTEYSKYEYDKIDTLTDTDEPKMYLPDVNSKSFPRDYDDYVYKGDVINIPTSSEYTSGFETFRIVNNDLSEIWRKNPIWCRWGFENSISSNDQPYLLNNSDLFEDFNRSVNPFSAIPSRIERNLDYFYTINSSTSSYTHHTLHVEDHLNGYLNTDFRFELDKYLNSSTYSIGTSSATYSFDYFSYFFGKKTNFQNGNIVKNTKKYSQFNIGNDDAPNITLFRNIKFLMYDIDNVKYENGVLTDISLKSSNTFDDYKFSILLSDNSPNDMEWYIVDEWNTKEKYDVDSIVVFDDMLFQTSIQSGPIDQIVNNKIYPWLYSGWSPYSNLNSLLWNPSGGYNSGAVVYNSGEYYLHGITASPISFWNPNNTYSIGDIVLYKTEFWISSTSSNIDRPSVISSKSNVDISYWEKTTNYDSACEWFLIQLFDINKPYITNDYVVYNEVVYVCSSPNGGESKLPTDVSNWSRVSSIVPDTNIVYTSTNNPVIYLNDKYYINIDNPNNMTLQNGINIYINHKYKNILVNISIDDNTIKNISGVDRDDMYGFNMYQLGMTYSNGLNSPVNSKLTAANLMSCINDISNKYGFTDNLNYIVIDENGVVSDNYNYNNLSGLTHMIKCEYPDELNIKVDSLIHKAEKSPIILMKPNRALNGGVLDDINNINYYNNLSPAYNISKSSEFNVNPMVSTDADNPPNRIVSTNIHGITNIVYNSIYRHSGSYMPIFYEIDLFKRPGLTSSLYGNYKFDTELTNFGKIKQRVISKVSRKGSILKLKDRNDFKSIYPMLDEFGYTTVDFFIFKSTWDYEYHIECSDNLNTSGSISTEDVVSSIKGNNNQNNI